MEILKGFLFENRYLAVVLLVILIYTVYLIFTHKFKEIVLGLMLQAERMAKAQILASGQPQEDWVYDRLEEFFPKYVGLIGEVRIRRFIKYLFRKAKDLLDDGKLNNSTV